MTYTPPEGVSIGAFTADTLPASFNAPVGSGISYKIYGTAAGVGTATSEGEPEGYKIPILNTSGVTENLYDGTDISGSLNNTYYINDFIYANLSQGTYTLAYDLETTATSVYASSIGVGTTGYSKDIQIQFTKTDGHFVFTFTIDAENAGKNLYARFARFSTLTTITYTASNIMLVKGSTPPDHYIPHRYTSNYDLFIGDTKLGAEEYVDYAEQKIYKMSGSTLVPTDPPAPLPAINTYKGENTLSSTETLGEVEFTGDWLVIMGSTQAESIDIEFTVDAEEYIAFVTVDDGPPIQVSDTITMPSSADSFTLEVVAWGRERYTDTVYNALS